MLNQLGGGWTISGISTWQQGGYIPAELGNGVPNFGMGLSYPVSSMPANYTLQGIGTGIGDATYFGTDESIPIMPVLTCNPTQGLIKYQVLNGKCFTAPAVGAQGGKAFPYMHATPYFDNDLAIYRSFHIHENQQVQLRVSAFDWLNHALPEFASNDSTPYSIKYNVDYSTQGHHTQLQPSKHRFEAFGVMPSKTQAPYQRIIELDLKYSF